MAGADQAVGLEVGLRTVFAGQMLLAAACGGAGWLRLGGTSAGRSAAGDLARYPETPEEALGLLDEGNRSFSRGSLGIPCGTWSGFVRCHHHSDHLRRFWDVQIHEYRLR
jgi:hypothetical protein